MVDGSAIGLDHRGRRTKASGLLDLDGQLAAFHGEPVVQDYPAAGPQGDVAGLRALFDHADRDFRVWRQLQERAGWE